MVKYIPAIIQGLALAAQIILLVRMKRRNKAFERRNQKIIEAGTKEHKRIMELINAQKN